MALARATGNDRRTAFASGLVLLTGFACMGLPRISGSDMLFTAILTLAGICLYRGWIKAFAPLWLFAGFALVALSALAGGLLGLVLPLLVSLVFLLWRGNVPTAGHATELWRSGCCLSCFSHGVRSSLSATADANC